jgi:hypothetical protein
LISTRLSAFPPCDATPDPRLIVVVKASSDYANAGGKVTYVSAPSFGISLPQHNGSKDGERGWPGLSALKCSPSPVVMPQESGDMRTLYTSYKYYNT